MDAEQHKPVKKETVIQLLQIKKYYENELLSVTWNKNGQGTACCPFHEDTKPSLSINSETGAFHCFGCSKRGSIYDFHMARYNLSFRDTLSELAQFTSINDSGTKIVAAEYNYTNATGELEYQVLRYDPKAFSQRRPDGKGGWSYNLRGVTTIPYNLAEVVKAETVFIVEGEKDVESVKTIGLVATTNSMGAGKWKSHYNPYFAGKDVIILSDNDEVGRRHARDVAKHLSGIARSIRIVDLPNLPEKGDVTDWIEAGGTREQLERIISGAPQWENKSETQTASMVFTILGDLFREEEEEVGWLVEGMLPSGGFSGIFGKPKGGKSTLARNLALRVARGEEFLGRTTNQGPVLYLALEEKRQELKKHFQDMGANGSEAIFVYASSAPIDALAQLWEIAIEKKPVLIIIDPLFRMAKVRDGNDYVQVTEALEPLLRLARDTGAHVLIVHHTGKGDRTGGDSILGSTAILGSVDTAILVKRTEKHRTIHTIQRYGQDMGETVLVFDLPTRTIYLGTSKDQNDLTDMMTIIFDYLLTQPEPLVEADILEAIEGRKATKVTAIRTLLEQGRIQRAGRGGKADPFKYSCSLVPDTIVGTRIQEPEILRKPLTDNIYCCSRDIGQANRSGEQETHGMSAFVPECDDDIPELMEGERWLS